MISVFDKLISLISSKVPMKNSTDNNVNCDNYYETGIYYLGSGLTNAPAAYIKLIVVGANKGQKGDVAQIAIAVSSGSVYIRTGNFSSSEQTIWWHNWITVYQNIVTGTPFETGRTIDGKKEYGIIVDCGSLPNNTSKSKSLPITLSQINITKIETLCKSGSGVIQNFEFYSGFNGLYLSTSQNTVIFATKVDGSAYNLHVTLYYTKS